MTDDPSRAGGPYRSGGDTARAALSLALKATAGGDRTALREVYELTSTKLFGICLRICGDRASAEDVLQTIYVKVWERSGQFEPSRASPITWLCTIARNAAIDWRRSAAGRAAATVNATERAMASVVDGQPLADAQLLEAESEARLHACLDGLDGRAQNCIRSAFFEGLTYSDLAERENIPLGTMKSVIRRALLKLKDCIGDG
ncbi:MAG: sigma-70 family RNA polymerase sigma factor [Novosphingobium sp.]|nr:sigma-70 family RNA polymerase sigma factor [Novosphingobium sp.]